MDDIKRSTDETIADIRSKIIDITAAARSHDPQLASRLNEVRDEALLILVSAIEAIERHASDPHEEGYVRGLLKAGLKADELYRDTMERIRRIKDHQEDEDAEDPENKTLNKRNDSCDGSMDPEDEEESVAKAKPFRTDLAEQAIGTLKDWLLPEGEEK